MSEKTPLELLESRMKAAEVTLVKAGAEGDPSVYDVFVPGAVRETTRVKATSEEEALNKVHDLLASKVEHYEGKKTDTPPTGESDGPLEVDSATHPNTTEDVA